MTDDPTELFDSILLTVTSVVLLGDNGSAEVYSGNKTVDLLALQDFYNMLAMNSDIPVGVYSKIRLYIDEIALVIRDENGNVIDTIYPDIPANGKIDLNPRDSFEVIEDSTLLIEIDVDAQKSIHIHETGNGVYKFRPVVFVRIVDSIISDGLVRIHGVISEINIDQSFFLLCDVDVFFNDNNELCLTINAVEDTSFFDQSGDPIDIDALQDGDEATVLGFVRTNENHQDDHDKDIQVDAIAVLLGPDGNFVQLDGIALSAVDDTSGIFDFEIAPGQGFGEGSRVDALVTDSTRILDSNFENSDTTAIDLGTEASIEGILMLSDVDPDTIKAALILLRDEESTADQLDGEIVDIDQDSADFLIDANDSQACVSTNDETRIFLVTVAADGLVSEEIAFAELEVGYFTANFGEYGDNSCFDASVIVASVGE